MTTTANARMVATRHYLADYQLHHSQPENPISAPAPNEQKPLLENNPPGWEDQWRSVPAYRPAQNQLDEQRTTYTSEVERNFVRVMFGGTCDGAMERWPELTAYRCVHDGVCESNLARDWWEDQ